MIYADSLTQTRLSRRDLKARLNAALPVDPISGSILANAGAIGITETDRPDHDPETQRVFEGKPEQVDGEWRQTWVVEDQPLEQAKANRADAVNERARVAQLAGFSFDFGGDVGTRVLDQRNATDDTAWLTVKSKASDAIAEGNGSTMIPMRDAANQTFAVTANVADNAMSVMADWRFAIAGRSWQLKDAINDAQSVSEVRQIDIETGWP